jgi:prepilin-type processing-associated H-X9-DG protein/prepilin-type N-terminal cleavage/methylation domain-containing protein
MRRQAARGLKRTAARAFTLIELLVVIGIIALLIALLMPALSAARSQAMTTRCAANLHDLGSAVQHYANDYKGVIPRGYYYFPWYQQGYILWAEALSTYVGHPVVNPDTGPARDGPMAQEFRQIGVYQCPVFPNEEQALDYVVNSWNTGDYNDSACIQMTKLRRASDLVYLTEANANRLTDQFPFHDVWDPTHLPVAADGTRQETARVMNDDRHRGRLNVLFLDGHTVTMHYRELKPKDFDPKWGQIPSPAAP